MRAISFFSKLQGLILSSNELNSIEQIPNEAKQLSSITSLSLSDNRLKSWKSIDCLASWLPSLQSLHIAGNPLGAVSDHNTFARLVTAHLPCLSKLNGTHISHNERVDSERYYLVQIEKDHPNSSDSEKSTLHPLWEELIKKHGHSPSRGDRQIKSSKLGNRLIGVQVSYAEHPPVQSSTPDQALKSSISTQLKVLPSMSISSFVLKVRKAHSLSRTIKLAFWILFDAGDGASTFARLALSRTDRDIELCGLEDGSRLLCCPA